MGQQLGTKSENTRARTSTTAGRDESRQGTSGQDRGAARGATSLGAGWRLLWVLLAVVLAVGVGYLVGSSDNATVAGLVSNADDASILQGEKEALTSNDSSTSRSWQAYTDRLDGLAEQGTRVAASGHDGAAAAAAANAVRQDGQVAAAGHDGGAAAAAAANAVRQDGQVAAAGHDGGAAADAANALRQDQ